MALFSSFFPKRFRLLWYFVGTYIVLSTIIRLVFIFWMLGEVDTSFFKIGNTLLIGFLFDVGTVSFFAIPYALYLLVFPQKWYGSLFDRI